MFADEVRAAFETYRRDGFPQSPDSALMPRTRTAGPAGWASRLAPDEAARMARAIELGGRGSFSWTDGG